MSITNRRSLPRTTAGLVAALALLLAGCTGGTGGGSVMTSESAGGRSGLAAGPGAADRELSRRGQTADGADGQDGKGGANRAPVRTRAVIHTGQVSLVSPDLSGTRAEVRRLLDGFGGYIAEEETSNARGEIARSRLVARIPSPAFDDAMNAFAGLGRLRSTDRQSDDVTTEVIDVEARVRAQDRSLQRLEALLSRAADLGDVIRLEAEIAERQAALDSLKGQQAYLADQTSLSTVTVYLATPKHRADPPGDRDDAGFLAGLSAGWSALKTVLVGAATMLGAVLPFTVVLVLLGLPTLLVLRRFRGSASTPG